MLILRHYFIYFRRWILFAAFATLADAKRRACHCLLIFSLLIRFDAIIITLRFRYYCLIFCLVFADFLIDFSPHCPLSHGFSASSCLITPFFQLSAAIFHFHFERDAPIRHFIFSWLPPMRADCFHFLSLFSSAFVFFRLFHFHHYFAAAMLADFHFTPFAITPYFATLFFQRFATFHFFAFFLHFRLLATPPLLCQRHI
jgi:hypothetical protein